MSVVSHIAAKRTTYGVPHAVTCRLLGVSRDFTSCAPAVRPPPNNAKPSWMQKVRTVFETSGRTYGSSRV